MRPSGAIMGPCRAMRPSATIMGLSKEDTIGYYRHTLDK